MKRLSRRALAWSVGIAVALSAAAAAQELPETEVTLGADPAPAAAAVPADDGIPAGYQLVAENEQLELYLDEQRAHLILRHRETGKIWRTNPDISGLNIAAELWRQHVASQFVVKYTDLDRRIERTTNPVAQEALVAYEPIRDGVRMIFTMQALGFIVPIEFTLGENYLEAAIRDDQLQEVGDYMIVDLELVPFFGAARNDREGYLVIPDGSGAVAEFTPDHPRYTRAFDEYAYGPESYTYWSEDISTWLFESNRPVPMPIFGIRDGDQGFVGVVTEGEYDVRIVAAPSGYIIDLYRAGAKFIVRKQYQAQLRLNSSVVTYENRRIPTDRAVRFYPLIGEEATYVGMANVYRDYLQQRHQVAGRLNMRGDVAPIDIRILHAVLEPGLVLDRLVTVTTFEQARQIVERLMDAGIEHMDVTLIGWQKDGWRGILPRHYPAERALGGDAGLRGFIEWANSHEIDVFLDDDFVRAFQSNGGFNNRQEVIRDPARFPVHNPYQGLFFLSPPVAYEKFARRDIPEMHRRYGAQGINFDTFGHRLFSDRNENFPSEREDTAFWWQQIARLTKETMGRVAAQGASVWLLETVDKYVNVPMDESRLVFVDYSIPWYQVVIHGLVPYTSYPGNVRNDPRREFLKMIEYGALPSFELTYEDSALLMETPYATLFSSQYELWVDTILEEYLAANVEMGYLQTMAMTGHRQLARNVFETTYLDGSRVLVNYRDEAFVTEDGIEIGPLDYVLVRGGVAE